MESIPSKTNFLISLFMEQFEVNYKGKKYIISQPSRAGDVFFSFLELADFLKVKLCSRQVRARIEVAFKVINVSIQMEESPL